MGFDTLAMERDSLQGSVRAVTEVALDGALEGVNFGESAEGFGRSYSQHT